MPIAKNAAGPGLPDASLDSRVLAFLGKPANSDNWFTWIEIYDGVHRPVAETAQLIGEFWTALATVGFQTHLEDMWRRGFIARAFFETGKGLAAFYSAKDPKA
jgi:hypothetical protein